MAIEIPARFENSTLDNYIPRDETQADFLKHVKALTEIDLADIKTGFYVYGESGTGKTHLMFSLIRELNKQAREKYMNIAVIPEGQFNVIPDQARNMAQKYYAFFIDEVTPKDAERLEALLSITWNRCVPVFLASNYPPEEVINLDQVTDNPHRRQRFVRRFYESVTDGNIDNKNAKVHIYELKNPNLRLTHLA